ncbi:DUF4349 domain-containing protein [Leadbettera azotonutricia]|uniref:Putative lipoprotein n=1 Tax=Leadbettera azotonutricia (strain ATCC BAA-888 / DSM 13862 / ZAS-9) TaxID=545695 RepID=F5YF55_LEAAZ|nr:DUF4349 domain-containing protein [Leadbettera azotonutricia]AEF80050.1 putative lipoprotein [Leadbettera azotonutricia ZAS-9]
MKRKTAPYILILCVIFLICACSMSGGQQAAASYGRAAYGEAMESPQADAEYAAGDAGAAEIPTQQSRKLVYQAELRIRVENPEAAEKPLADLMAKYEAWSSSTRIYENSRDYTVRVPSKYYDAFLKEAANLGRVLRRTESAEDVTLRYYDLEGRLSTKQELLKTYQGYLSKAKDIDEIMTVEKRIAELQQEIDWTGTQLRNLSNLVDYATVDLELQGPVAVSSYSAPTMGERLSELFGSFGEIAQGAVVVLLGVIIYGVPAILIVVLLFWILFGRIGFIKKLWRLASGKRS